MIISYQTNTHISHFIPQNHFRWNFSKRTAGESTGKVVTGQINSNEHHRQEAIKSSQHIKITPITPKVFFKKSTITHHSIRSINTPIIQPIIQPIITSPWGAHLGRANAPAEAPGPGRSEDQARQDEIILHDWHGAKKVVILSCQKNTNPSRSRRKNLSRNEKSSDTTNENWLCRRLADTRDLKSLSGDRVRVRPRRQY